VRLAIVQTCVDCLATCRRSCGTSAAADTNEITRLSPHSGTTIESGAGAANGRRAARRRSSRQGLVSPIPEWAFADRPRAFRRVRLVNEQPRPSRCAIGVGQVRFVMDRFR